MQFKTKLGLVDIPNAEVLAAADEIRGPVISDQRLCEVFDAMEAEQRAEFEDYKRRCGGSPISNVKP